MKKKILNLEEKLLLNKIAGYSVLAGAALLLTPTAAKGDIVYVNPADIIVSSTIDSFEIDIDGDGFKDFKFNHFSSEAWTGYSNSYLYIFGMDTNNYVSATNLWLAKRTNDISVASGNTWKGSKYFAKGYFYTSSTIWNVLDGNWKTNADDKYFGVKFEISNSTHYGWIRASASMIVGNMQITIHDWAYENEAGVSLKTGEGETALSIELSHFTALEENGAIRLNWQTASETENSGYVIQRKIANSAWENLADFHNDPTLEGHGTTSESHSYSWLDESVLPGATYQYRLGDVDHANTTVWHDVVEITMSEEGSQMPAEFGLQAAFPNPFNPQLTIRYGLTEDAQTTVNILDLQGKTIATLENKFQKAGSYELTWQAIDNASGVYLVEVVSGEKSDLRKVLLTK
jgi:hypothetical protein